MSTSSLRRQAYVKTLPGTPLHYILFLPPPPKNTKPHPHNPINHPQTPHHTTHTHPHPHHPPQPRAINPTNPITPKNLTTQQFKLNINNAKSTIHNPTNHAH